MATNLGEYSVVVYRHELRGECINVGVLVWHPRLGSVYQLPKGLTRIRTIDSSVDLERVRSGLDRIRIAMEAWTQGQKSPLDELSAQFRHRLVVTMPQQARMQDPASLLERLVGSLLPPSRPVRASSNRQFATAFASQLRKVLEHAGVFGYEGPYLERATFRPVPVTARYQLFDDRFVWRAVSFSSLDNMEQQINLAKAVYTDNSELLALDEYRDAHLSVAVEMPKPQYRGEWGEAQAWLERIAERIEPFEDRMSLPARIPEIVISQHPAPLLDVHRLDTGSVRPGPIALPM